MRVVNEVIVDIRVPRKVIRGLGNVFRRLEYLVLVPTHQIRGFLRPPSETLLTIVFKSQYVFCCFGSYHRY